MNLGEVAFDVNGTVVALSRSSATVLAEKLHNFDRGQYDSDVAELRAHGVEPGWLDGAEAAAQIIEDVLTDTRRGPIPLDPSGKASDAVFAVLSLTGPVYSDVQSDVSRLHAVLRKARQ
jgi:hypothetical protein